MTYNESLSSENPGYIVILIDQSGSMSESFAGSTNSKDKECAQVVNRVLREIGLSCTVGDAIKNRCDISMLSYGSSVKNAFSGNLASNVVVTLQELVQNAIRVDIVKVKVSDGAGGFIEIDEEFPVWIDPIASGGTPMTEVFEMAYNLIEKWTISHQFSFPPIVINITDGEPNDQLSAKSAALGLTQLGTNDGNTLIMNIHLSESRAAQVKYPASASELPSGNSYAQFLFDISSELPPVMRERAEAVGYKPIPGARGFVFNADAEALVRFLDIGTRAKLR